jgi:hypothetical protein
MRSNSLRPSLLARHSNQVLTEWDTDELAYIQHIRSFRGIMWHWSTWFYFWPNSIFSSSFFSLFTHPVLVLYALPPRASVSSPSFPSFSPLPRDFGRHHRGSDHRFETSLRLQIKGRTTLMRKTWTMPCFVDGYLDFVKCPVVVEKNQDRLYVVDLVCGQSLRFLMVQPGVYR